VLEMLTTCLSVSLNGPGRFEDQGADDNINTDLNEIDCKGLE
jgi:hypothetical protein